MGQDPPNQAVGLLADFVATFFVNDVVDIHWNDEAYDHLVYPEEQKDLILTFVENHTRTHNLTDDVIAGKGKIRLELLFVWCM